MNKNGNGDIKTAGRNGIVRDMAVGTSKNVNHNSSIKMSKTPGNISACGNSSKQRKIKRGVGFDISGGNTYATSGNTIVASKDRWLLTRKTWKYMADAGRKLIPDGIGGGTSGSITAAPVEEIRRIEEYFQQVCRSETRFLPWKRKLSYPGALTSLRRHKRRVDGGISCTAKNSGGRSSPTSPPKVSFADSERMSCGFQFNGDESQRLLVMIQMIEKYLNIKEPEAEEDAAARKDDENENKIDRSYFNMIERHSQNAPENTNSNKINAPASGTQLHTEQSFSLLSQKVARSTEQLKLNWLAQPFDSGSPGDVGDARPTTVQEARGHVLSQKQTGIPVQTHSNKSFAHLVLCLFLVLCLQNNFILIIKQTSATETTTALQSSGYTHFTNDMIVRSTSHRTSHPNSSWSSANIHSALLLECLRSYNRTNQSPLLHNHSITPYTLLDKQLLRQIRDELKQQHIQKLLRKQHLRSRNSANINSSIGISGVDGTEKNKYFCKSDYQRIQNHNKHLKFDPSTKTLGDLEVSPTQLSPVQRLFRSGGVQTDPISICCLQKLNLEYKSLRAEENDGGLSETDGSGSKRKNSIDNEDVSQSVSDTIKRYLRMARKKNGNGIATGDDAAATRFKSVNYDKNLRNIRSKGEITLPGDDDGLSKGSQTDRGWIANVMAEIAIHSSMVNSASATTPSVPAVERSTLSHLSGSAYLHIHSFMTRRSGLSFTSPESQSLSGDCKVKSTSPTNSSPPSISGGLFHSSTQFLSNLLWNHGSGGGGVDAATAAAVPTTVIKTNTTTTATDSIFSNNDFNSNSAAQTTGTPTHVTSTSSVTDPVIPTGSTDASMQKSKSSSNVVGQVFGKKIWKSRSKSQTPSNRNEGDGWDSTGSFNTQDIKSRGSRTTENIIKSEWTSLVRYNNCHLVQTISYIYIIFT